MDMDYVDCPYKCDCGAGTPQITYVEQSELLLRADCHMVVNLTAWRRTAKHELLPRSVSHCGALSPTERPRLSHSPVAVRLRGRRLMFLSYFYSRDGIVTERFIQTDAGGCFLTLIEQITVTDL